MRVVLAAAVAAVAIAVLPATAAAQTTYNDQIVGAEIAATSTQGTFVGRARGDLPGAWKAVVQHTPLSPGGTITGGSFSLWTLFGGAPARVRGNVSGGTITQTNAGAGCTNQTYDVTGTLANVSVASVSNGTGSFAVVLTHYRAAFPFFGCVTYSASVAGTLSLTL